MTARRKAKISTSSQGGKTVQCVRCAGQIEPYAGRAVSLLSGVYAHQPGKCADRSEQAAKAHAFTQDTLFGWSCAHVEPSCDGKPPESCHVTGGDRAEYVSHMREHGKRILTSPAVIKLRKTPAAAPRVVPNVPKPLKMLTWTEHYPQTAGPDLPVERRGQFWANGPETHTVWAITYTAPGSGQRPELVKLYVCADGSVTRNWSDAAWSRREGSRLAKLAA